MLRWRLTLGTLFIAALVGLCWLDYVAPRPGAVLLLLALVLTAMATDETLQLLAAAGMRHSSDAAKGGNLLLVVVAWFAGSRPDAGWTVLLTAGIVVLFLFIAEVVRYQKPDAAAASVAAGVFALVYVGLLMSFLILLRMSWGIGALASLVIVVKLGDTGAYTVGRLVGRHKLSPKLSPGKTVEGAVGALVFSAAGSWATFRWLMPLLAGGSPHAPQGGLGWLAFGLAVSVAGMLGDLAESLIKRDAGQKDSSRWLLSKSFGGVLDVLDSILLAAPVAYGFWAFGVVG